MQKQFGMSSDTINLITNLIGGVVSLVISIAKLFVTGLVYVIGKVLTDGVANVENGSTPAEGTVTPFKIFFNKYKVLDINFFDVNASGNITPRLRESVAKWFYVVRNIAAVLLLIVLIYIGIRMAISTVASDKARYKKMLFDWATSLVLIFVLQYMAIFLIFLNNAIVEMIEKLATSITDIDSAVDTILLESLFGIGLNGIMAFLVYVMLTIQTIFFLIAYINRLIKIAFLIIISPLISITYSIDKIGDGKAQALNTWLKEFLYSILIQPFDCIMYIAFVSAAAKLLVPSSTNILDILGLNPEVNVIANGVLAVLCLKFINDGEKMIKKIFHFEDTDTGTSMAAGAALTMAAVQRTQKVATSGKKFFGKDSAIGKAVTKDMKFLKETKVGQNLSGKFDKAKDVFNNSKIGKGLSTANRTISGVNKRKNAFFQSKGGMKLSRFASKTSSLALGGMAAAMAYAGGDLGALEAFAMGKRVSRLSEQNFAKSINTVAGGIAKSNEDLEKADMKYLDKDIADVTSELLDSGVEQDELDDIEGLDKKAEEEDKNVEKTRQEVAQERIKELSDSMANLEAMMISRPEKLNAKRYEEYEQMKKEKELLEKGNYDSINNNQRIIEAQKKATKVHANCDIARKRQRLLLDKQNFYTEEAIKERAVRRGRSISEKELKDKKNEIIAMIMKIRVRRKLGQSEEIDIDTNDLVTNADYESAKTMAEELISTMQHEVLLENSTIRERKFDISDYIERNMGISVTEDSKSLGYQLASIAEDYKYLLDRNNVAQNGFGVAESFGVKRDDFAERLADTTILNGRRTNV